MVDQLAQTACAPAVREKVKRGSSVSSGSSNSSAKCPRSSNVPPTTIAELVVQGGYLAGGWIVSAA